MGLQTQLRHQQQEQQQTSFLLLEEKEHRQHTTGSPHKQQQQQSVPIPLLQQQQKEHQQQDASLLLQQQQQQQPNVSLLSQQKGQQQRVALEFQQHPQPHLLQQEKRCFFPFSFSQQQQQQHGIYLRRVLLKGLCFLSTVSSSRKSNCNSNSTTIRSQSSNSYSESFTTAKEDARAGAAILQKNRTSAVSSPFAPSAATCASVSFSISPMPSTPSAAHPLASSSSLLTAAAVDAAASNKHSATIAVAHDHVAAVPPSAVAFSIPVAAAASQTVASAAAVAVAGGAVDDCKAKRELAAAAAASVEMSSFTVMEAAAAAAPPPSFSAAVGVSVLSSSSPAAAAAAVGESEAPNAAADHRLHANSSEEIEMIKVETFFLSGVFWVTAALSLCCCSTVTGDPSLSRPQQPTPAAAAAARAGITTAEGIAGAKRGEEAALDTAVGEGRTAAPRRRAAVLRPAATANSIGAAKGIFPAATERQQLLQLVRACARSIRRNSSSSRERESSSSSSSPRSSSSSRAKIRGRRSGSSSRRINRWNCSIRREGLSGFPEMKIRLERSTLMQHCSRTGLTASFCSKYPSTEARKRRKKRKHFVGRSPQRWSCCSGRSLRFKRSCFCFDAATSAGRASAAAVSRRVTRETPAEDAAAAAGHAAAAAAGDAAAAAGGEAAAVGEPLEGRKEGRVKQRRMKGDYSYRYRIFSPFLNWRSGLSSLAHQARLSSLCNTSSSSSSSKKRKKWKLRSHWKEETKKNRAAGLIMKAKCGTPNQLASPARATAAAAQTTAAARATIATRSGDVRCDVVAAHALVSGGEEGGGGASLGFAASVKRAYPASLLSTLHALQILFLLHSAEEVLSFSAIERIKTFVFQLQDPHTGAFFNDSSSTDRGVLFPLSALTSPRLPTTSYDSHQTSFSSSSFSSCSMRLPSCCSSFSSSRASSHPSACSSDADDVPDVQACLSLCWKRASINQFHLHPPFLNVDIPFLCCSSLLPSSVHPLSSYDPVLQSSAAAAAARGEHASSSYCCCCCCCKHHPARSCCSSRRTCRSSTSSNRRRERRKSNSSSRRYVFDSSSREVDVRFVLAALGALKLLEIVKERKMMHCVAAAAAVSSNDTRGRRRRRKRERRRRRVSVLEGEIDKERTFLQHAGRDHSSAKKTKKERSIANQRDRGQHKEGIRSAEEREEKEERTMKETLRERENLFATSDEVRQLNFCRKRHAYAAETAAGAAKPLKERKAAAEDKQEYRKKQQEEDKEGDGEGGERGATTSLSCESQEADTAGEKKEERQEEGIFEMQKVDTLNEEIPYREKLFHWLLQCQNLDGGFGCAPGCESHAGATFCVVGALQLLGFIDAAFPPHSSRREDLTRWLGERQQEDGGLNGRGGKASDSCYCWWVLATLRILKICPSSLFNVPKLCVFLASCQHVDGGISRAPQREEKKAKENRKKRIAGVYDEAGGGFNEEVEKRVITKEREGETDVCLGEHHRKEKGKNGACEGEEGEMEGGKGEQNEGRDADGEEGRYWVEEERMHGEERKGERREDEKRGHGRGGEKERKATNEEEGGRDKEQEENEEEHLDNTCVAFFLANDEWEQLKRARSPDPFHTFFALAGLSLLFEMTQNTPSLCSTREETHTNVSAWSRLPAVHPVLALPLTVLQTT